jgi:D-alanyl-D-alanine carboxypeptidase (penicillin-binding protein 5/6)
MMLFKRLSLNKYSNNVILSLCFIFVFLLWGSPIAMISRSKTLNDPSQQIVTHAKSAVLMDAHTGTILLEKNKDQRLPPASITKIMTMLLIMEAIEQGKISMTDQVETSEYAASMGGSQIFLKAGEQMSVKEMLKGIALASGNDASVAMAEKIAGSEAVFVEMMNKRAKELGMHNTQFANCNGLPHKDHYSTAADIALMSKALLLHEEVTSFTGLYQDYLRQHLTTPFWLVNTNKLVRFYQGADGLKTGYTQEAKYCLSATAKRDHLRLIAVVMGEPNTKIRNLEVSQLFDYAFAQYYSAPVIQKGEKLGELVLPNGDQATVPLIASRSIDLLLKKGEPASAIRYEMQLLTKLKAPIQQGQMVGKILIYHQDVLKREWEITCPVDVRTVGWWTICKRKVRQMLRMN